MLELKDTAKIMQMKNKEAAIIAGEITVGNLLNDRLSKIVIPQLPVAARMMANTAVGKALLANAFAAGMIHFMPGNAKATKAGEFMVQSAMVDLINSFNIEDMVDEFLDGVKLPNFAPATKAPVDELDLTNIVGKDETVG